ncbi:WD40-repeat-containing domain protein [Pilobolus umbonatus]|nr:WD40-repeat-containing domain protein [Pilobolus umbonatus]
MLSKSLVSASSLRQDDINGVSLVRQNDPDSSDSSSSSESETVDSADSPLRSNKLKLSQLAHSLQLKLERLLAKQSKLAERSKSVTKNIKHTSRQLMELTSVLLDNTVDRSPQNKLSYSNNPATATTTSASYIMQDNYRPISSPQVAKRTVPFAEEDNRGKFKLAKSDDSLPPVVSIERQAVKNSPVSSTRNRQDVMRRSSESTRRYAADLPIASFPSMDIYSLRQMKTEVCFRKKPRSILFSNSRDNRNASLANLMLTTSLDGDLQFWDARSRRTIKQLEKSILFDTWIDDLCWLNDQTLALIPSHKTKTNSTVELIHLRSVSQDNVEGETQRLLDEPHENSISAIAPVESGNDRCSFVTGGSDKSVYLWGLPSLDAENKFVTKKPYRLNIKHTSAVYSLCFNDFHNVLYSGGCDEKFCIYDMATSSVEKEMRLGQRVSHIMPFKTNPNISLITLTQRSEQFLIYDHRTSVNDGIQLRFGQPEEETLSRYVKPDIHDNGYMICCGSQSTYKVNFWDTRYVGVDKSISFHMDTGASSRIVRSCFVPQQNVVVTCSSTRNLSWLDYDVQHNQIVKSL